MDFPAHYHLIHVVVQVHARGIERLLQRSGIPAQLPIYPSFGNDIRLLDVFHILAGPADPRRDHVLSFLLGGQISLLQLLSHPSHILGRNVEDVHVAARLPRVLAPCNESVDDGQRGDIPGRSAVGPGIPRRIGIRHIGESVPPG